MRGVGGREGGKGKGGYWASLFRFLFAEEKNKSRAKESSISI